MRLIIYDVFVHISVPATHCSFALIIPYNNSSINQFVYHINLANLKYLSKVWKTVDFGVTC